MEIKLGKDNILLFRGKTVNLALNTVAPAIQVYTDGEDEIPISGPGEYEVKGVQILGFQDGVNSNYKIKIDGLQVVFIVASYSQSQEEIFSDADVLILGQNQANLVLKLEPKIVVIYDAKDATKFLKDIGREGVLPVTRLVVKKDHLPDELEAVWLKP